MQRLVLFVAVALLALAGPAVKWLVTEGGEAGLTAPGAISFCNVLFVGNLVAGVLTLSLSGPRRITRSLRQVDRRGWGLMAISVALAVAIPALIFTALASTTVTSLVLLGRLESVFFAIFAFALLRVRPTRQQWLSYGVISAGVITIVLMQGMGRLARGDVLIIAAALLQGLAACVSRNLVERHGARVFVFCRNFMSAIVFFLIAVRLYGFDHFADAFGPGLWLVMSGYALVIVVVGQLAWYRSLATLPPTTVASWSMLSPALGLLFAFLLLHEIPTTPQIVGGLVILTGMAVGGFKPSAAADPPRADMTGSLAAA